MRERRFKGFTLVELIVVITILAILATIGFVSMQGYAKSSRESKRLSDLQVISRSLELFRADVGYFPDPTNSFNVTFSGSLAWQQGEFGGETRAQTKRISEVPLDPLLKNPYTYSITNSRQEYELGAISESLVSITPLSQSYAANNFYTHIKGNYNKQIVTVRQSDMLYILGVPTIITTEINDVTVEQLLASQSFSVENSQNLPSSYANSLPVGQTHTGAISFLTGSLVDTVAPILYEGNISELDLNQRKYEFGSNLKTYYLNSNINSHSVYDNILNTGSGEIVSYVNTLIKTNTGGIPGDNITINENIHPCYNPGNVGTIGTQGVCSGMLIVNNEMLRSAASAIIGGNETFQILGPDSNTYTFADSAHNVFTGLVTDMNHLFHGTSFNSNINYWDTRNVTNMNNMFNFATVFNQPLDNWNVSNVESMVDMFMVASVFNQPLNTWDTRSLTDMSRTFAFAGAFNQALDNWDTSNVTTMWLTFNGAAAFNQPINNWDVSKVGVMSWMFRNASSFNQALDSWDVSNVSDMILMFSISNYDQDISNWDVSNVIACFDFDQSTPGSWTVGEKPNFTGCTP